MDVSSEHEVTLPDLSKSAEAAAVKGECPACRKQYDALSYAGSAMVECTKCGRWTHRGCDGITAALYQELSRPERQEEPFHCVVCRAEAGETKRFASDELNVLAEQAVKKADEAKEVIGNVEGENKTAATEAWKPPQDLFASVWAITSWYGSRPFLGRRKRDAEGKLGPFEWATYDETWQAATNFGAGLMQLELMRPGEFLGIMSINRPEWVQCDWTCVQYNFVSVPLVVTLDDETLVFVINQAEIRCVVVSADLAAKIVAVASQCPLLKGIVVMEDEPLPLAKGLAVCSMRQVVDMGKTSFPGDFPGRLRKPEDLITIIYTSGSTGMPKGAMMSDRRWNHFITRGYLMPQPCRVLSFAPLGHVSERQLFWLCSFYGGEYGFYSGDMADLTDDFQTLNPTYLSCPPRIYNAVYAEYKEACDAEVAKQGADQRWRIELETLDKFRGVFGNAIQFLVTGSAPTSEVVKEFLRRCFCVPLYDGYGTTEAGGIATDGVISRDVKVHLLDVPELGYSTADKPYPRGEICVNTDVMIEGYFKNQAKTDEAFVTVEGKRYFRTGDIGFRRLDHQVEIIDRVKNVFKLAQGEFVAPSKIESALEKSKFVEQVCVSGAPVKTPEKVVAIVVPNYEVCCRMFRGAESLEQLVNGYAEQLELLILADFRRIAASAGLLSYEVPGRVIFSPCLFSAENDMLTPSLKLKRSPIEQRFRKQIDAAAASAMGNANDGTRQLISDALGAGAELQLDSTFQLQGGDSLSAVKLVSKIKQRFGKDVPVSFLLQNPTLDELARYVEGHVPAGSHAVPTLPKSALQDMADPRSHLGPLAGVEPAPFAESKCVLLTGATGFLGAFLLRDILKSLPECIVVCLVRGGIQRLRDSVERREFADQVDWARVEVVDGDLSSGALGLGEAKRFNQMCRRVDAVFHSAANVNWMLSYDALRSSNVLPCLDLLRFCTTGKAKRLFHVSTVSCSPSRYGPDGKSLEFCETFGDDDWAALSGPYAQSKYVAEKVLLACERQLYFSLLRPANIMADSVTGSSNVTDFSDRYVATALELGLAIDEAAVTNFTPVEYVSSTCVRIALKNAGVGPFLLSNNASPSFALIAQALEDAEPTIKRVSFAAFRERLLQHPHPETLQLFGLLPLFQAHRPFIYNSVDRSDCSNTLALVPEPCPSTTVEALSRWLAYLGRVGFIRIRPRRLVKIVMAEKKGNGLKFVEIGK